MQIFAFAACRPPSLIQVWARLQWSKSDVQQWTGGEACWEGMALGEEAQLQILVRCGAYQELLRSLAGLPRAEVVRRLACRSEGRQSPGWIRGPTHSWPCYSQALQMCVAARPGWEASGHTGKELLIWYVCSPGQPPAGGRRRGRPGEVSTFNNFRAAYAMPSCAWQVYRYNYFITLSCEV